MGEMADDRGQLLPATLNLHESLTRAEEYAVRRKHSVVGLDHLLLALIEDQDAASLLIQGSVDLKGLCAELLRKLGPEARMLSPNPIPPTLDITIQNLLSHASLNARENGYDMMTGAHIISVILNGDGGMITQKMLLRHGLQIENTRQHLQKKQEENTPHFTTNEVKTDIRDNAEKNSPQKQPQTSSKEEEIKQADTPIDLELDDENFTDDTIVQAEAHPSDYGTADEEISDYPIPPSDDQVETNVKAETKSDKNVPTENIIPDQGQKPPLPKGDNNNNQKEQLAEQFIAHKQQPVPMEPPIPPDLKPDVQGEGIQKPIQSKKNEQPVYDNLASPPDRGIKVSAENKEQEESKIGKENLPTSDPENIAKESNLNPKDQSEGASTRNTLDQKLAMTVPTHHEQPMQSQKVMTPPPLTQGMHNPIHRAPPIPPMQPGQRPMPPGANRAMQPGQITQTPQPMRKEHPGQHIKDEQTYDNNAQKMENISTSINKTREALEAENDQIIEFIPKVMRKGKIHFVEVRVARFTNTEMELGPENYGLRAKNDSKPITKAITVRLSSPEGQFLIDSVTPSTQWSEYHATLVDDADFAIWRWRVFPLHAGKSRMRLDVTMRTSSENGLTGELPVQPSRSIEIKVTRNYLKLAKQILAIAALIGVSVLVTKYGLDMYQLAISEIDKLGLLKYIK